MYGPTYFSAEVSAIFVSADAVSYVFQTQRLSPFSVYYIGAFFFLSVSCTDCKYTSGWKIMVLNK